MPSLVTREELQLVQSTMEARFSSLDAELAALRQQGDRLSSVLDRIASPLRRVRGIGRDRADG
jgi:hypothetical protein